MLYYSDRITLFIGGYIFANIIPDKMADASAFLSFFYGGVMENSFTQGKIYTTLIAFAFPVFIAMLLQALYGTVDLLVVGRFGDATGVSAVSTGSQIMQMITGIVTGLTMGTTVLLGQRIGQKDEESAARTIGSAFCFFIVLGIAMSIITAVLSRQMAYAMQAPEKAFDKTAQYVAICGGGTVFTVLFNAAGGVFRGMGNSKLPLLLVAVACFVNIIGDIILVGIFGLDAAGAAITTVSAQAISVIAAFYIVVKKGFPFAFCKRHIRLFRSETLLILKFGLPIAAQEALTGLSFLVIIAILNGFGLIASAGVGVAEKICALIFIFPSSFMSALSAFTAQNIGAGKKERAKKALMYSAASAVSIGILMFMATFFSGARLASVFTSDTQVMAACGSYLKAYSIDCIIVGIVFSMMGYFNGCGKTLFVALQGIASTFLVRIPVSYFMSKIEGVSLFQIGFATPLASVFSVILCCSYYMWNEKGCRNNVLCRC